MHLTIAIPTYNRCDYLKKNIEVFDSMRRPPGLNVSLSISNSASIDETENYLSGLEMKRNDLQLFNQVTDWNGGNFGYLSQTIPKNVDWVWFMGDDDFLFDESSIWQVWEVIKSNQDNEKFGFIHACQARRSSRSGAVITDNVVSLCNRFGYLEMFGWMSSIVMRRDPFVHALRKADKRGQVARNETALENSHSAFFQARYLLAEIHEMQGAFIDMPLVEPQEQDMTDASRERWKNENMGTRYIYVVKDFQRLCEWGVPLSNLDEAFFRYHTYHLWDRFIIHQLNIIKAYGDGDRSDVIVSSMGQYVQNWELIGKIPTFIRDRSIRKHITNSVESNIALCNLYFESKFSPSVHELLSRQMQLHSVEVYDFNIMKGGEI